MSQTATDIGSTNLIELDIPTEGPPTASKPYTIPLKYHEFVDHKIQQLEEASYHWAEWLDQPYTGSTQEGRLCGCQHQNKCYS